MTSLSSLASRAGALGIAYLFLGMTNAHGQPVANLLNLNTPPGFIRAPLPKLESVTTTSDNVCQVGQGTTASSTVFAAVGAGYRQAGEPLGAADVFGGLTNLLLRGSGMADVSSVVVVLPDGRRLTPRVFNKTCLDGARTAIGLTFDLPGVSVRSTARLQVMAPEPPPLVAAAPPTLKVCTDPMTGAVKSCPALPPLAGKAVTVADIGLILHPRPSVVTIEPRQIQAVGAREVCGGRLRLSGQNLGNATLRTDGKGRADGFTSTTVSQTATAVFADVQQSCITNTMMAPTFIGVGVMLRRGIAGDFALVPECDTCASPPSRSFGPFTVIRFLGPGYCDLSSDC